jgi:hypothetical protein
VRRARHERQALRQHINQETPLLGGQELLDGNVGVTDVQPECAVSDQANELTCFVLASGSQCSTPRKRLLAHVAQQHREGTIVRKILFTAPDSFPCQLEADGAILQLLKVRSQGINGLIC